jgi:hypothetical protein
MNKDTEEIINGERERNKAREMKRKNEGKKQRDQKKFEARDVGRVEVKPAA